MYELFIQSCLGCRCPDDGSSWGAGAASVRGEQGLPGARHSWLQLASVSAATIPPQDTPEPISQAGGTPVETYLRKGKNTTQADRTQGGIK